eukprot:8915877-Pyramimonas_sp.AAC.1
MKAPEIFDGSSNEKPKQYLMISSHRWRARFKGPKGFWQTCINTFGMPQSCSAQSHQMCCVYLTPAGTTLTRFAPHTRFAAL